MRKVFLNYEEQIRKLVHEKQLIIKDKEYAIEMLKRYSYYSLIGGYREKFKNPETKRYYAGTCFEDIVALYEFDEQLREIFLRYLLKIEGQIKSHLSFYFCQKYGELQSEYLNPLNYNNIKKNCGDITKLIKTMSRFTSGKTDYQYINHAARKYGNVPLWVLMNVLTFGNISKMYLLSQCDIQTQIAKNYIGVSEKEMTNFLAFLTQFRNVCAHGERLFTHRTKIAIPTMTLHKKLNLPKRGKEYIFGKHDLFAVVIAMRYLLPSDWFRDFKKELTKVIKCYINKSKYFSEKQLLEFMGFPENWKKITRYKK
ncbi:MAG: Abi family protein [Lachnospiraceae bacterium]|nr:Abi family protein [Lachnospiraceae bacterium]